MARLMRPEAALQYLAKRADHLARRIAEAQAGGRILSWDIAELAALRTAIAELEKGKTHQPDGDVSD
jgi:hypothetical protein